MGFYHTAGPEFWQTLPWSDAESWRSRFYVSKCCLNTTGPSANTVFADPERSIAVVSPYQRQCRMVVRSFVILCPPLLQRLRKYIRARASIVIFTAGAAQGSLIKDVVFTYLETASTLAHTDS